MIPKVVGYTGFQSYGDLPYPSLKAGKTKLSPNDLWARTTRDSDKLKFHDNSNFYNSIYNKTQCVNVQPEDYKDHKHCKFGDKSRNQFLNAASNNLTKYDATDPNSRLNSGTEHWKSNYGATAQSSYTYNKAKRPEWTYHKPPYTVDNQMGPSEYKFQMGTIGSNPYEKLKPDGTLKEGKFYDKLKMGTTQATYHIPGYTGFIPESSTKGLAIQHAQAEAERKIQKISIVENYHTKIPGYAGHQPKAPTNQKGYIREYCFTTQSNCKI